MALVQLTTTPLLMPPGVAASVLCQVFQFTSLQLIAALGEPLMPAEEK